MLTEKQFLADLIEGIKNIYNYLHQHYEFFETDPDKYRPYFLNDPEWAYYYASYVDKKPRDDTRKAACGAPDWAYEYAYYVDEKPRDDTRKAACGAPEGACYYARWVDKAPRDDTRKAALGAPEWAYRYARYVDKKSREDTFNAVIGSTYEEKYIIDVGKPSC